MLKQKKTVEQEIHEFLNYWNCEQQIAFLRDIIPLFELYDVESHKDWLSDQVGEADLRNVRLVRTVYLISRIAEFHAGTLCLLKSKFKNIYKKLERVADEV